MTDERRIDAYLVCAGKWHDFDYARLQLLTLLAEDHQIRVQVGQDYGDVAAITAADFLVSYACDLRPADAQQQAIREWVEGGGRWLALHGTNCALDPPGDAGVFTAPRVFPTWVDTLGSQFLSHPAMEPYTVTRSPEAEHDPLVAGIESFESSADDELYLMEHHGEVIPLMETRWTGTTQGFADAEWPDDERRLVLYKRPLGDGGVLYCTLGHCRSHWDLIDPPFNGARWPKIQRGSWEIPAFIEIVRRGISWAAQTAPSGSP